MIDIKLLRQNPERLKKKLEDKLFDSSLVDKALELDNKRRAIQIEVEGLRARQNELTEKIKMGEKSFVSAATDLKNDLKSKEPEFEKLNKEFMKLFKTFPNLAADEVPVGKDESENKPVRKWGEIPKFGFKPKDHVELGESLGIINIEKAGKIVGTRFGYLMGDAALLEFALIQFAFDVLTNQKIISNIAKKITNSYSDKTFIPVVPPVMINPEVYDKMARRYPEEERYFIQSDNTFLIGSAEHTLGPLHMGETLYEKDLPIRYVGFSTAFRKEAGTYGKDTRGILRVHQFDKVEMESFTTSENGQKEQDFCVAIQEYIMQSLKLPYQVVDICTGDMGGPDYRQIDIETWLPGQNKYRETHSSDYVTDYQARRLETKVKLKDKTEIVHMNDATAIAIGRTIIAILENYQEKDGSVVIPEVLRKWMGKEKIVAGR